MDGWDSELCLLFMSEKERIKMLARSIRTVF
jgi:hypothetical protein